ncbi:ABC transporter permease [Arcobacteraceae bacterium]|nr:ABC transporter permease [Arcobacteraceae bacterium]
MFRYILKKEFLLVFRNLHALLVLFVMPTAFIIIMSLALQNTYSNSIDVKFKVLVSSETKSKSINDLLSKLEDNNFFEIRYVDGVINDKNIIYKRDYDYLVHIPSDYLKAIQKNEDTKIDLYSKPDSSIQNINLLKNLLSSNISKQLIKNLLVQLDVDTTKTKDFYSNIQHHYVSKQNSFKITSVQQSVPAWLIFSMFFILIPISNTFINEKNFGTLNRIRSINVSMFPILMGKVIPYYVINLIQVCFMIAVGVYMMPLLGADSLQIKGNIGLIFILASAVSLAAIAFALVIANIAKKSEDATSIGGISNIILAALGGIMVPKFIMPQSMQELSNLSPMSWALDSFLELFVNGGTFVDIQNSLFKLFVFAIICFFIAYILLQRKK